MLKSNILTTGFLFAMGTSWGTITFNCATTSTGNAFSSYGSSAAGNGCATGDLSFELLNVINGASSSSTTSNLFLYGVSALGTGAAVGPAGSVNLFLDGTGIGSYTAGNTNAAATVSGFANAHTGGSYPTPGNASLSWTIGAFTLSATGNASNQAGITITRTFCIGATTTAGCTAANSGVITATDAAAGGTFTFVCSALGVNINGTSCSAGTVSFARHVLNVAFSDVVDLTTGSGNHSVSLTNWETSFAQFADAPEPSTFFLSGAALAALFALRSRARRA